MPPKKAAPQPNKKTEQKKKEKVIEDKTFGIKNKKGAKQQRYIKNVEVQVKQGGVNARKTALQQNEQEKAKQLKEKKEKEKEELNMLFRPVQQTLGKGVDPKSVLCAFFKQGTCTKGDKCKFSHDLNIHRKTEKRSMYEDTRESQENETMENWDIDKLTEVVETKMGKNKQPTTTIICKYFLEALEKSTYGWFWECPNGEKCIYKHALPPGYVLKKDVKKAEKGTEISMEELIEKERASLGTTTTKVTLESFLKWKERKKREKQDKATADEEKKKSEYRMGKMSGISGRQMFEFDPDLIVVENEDGEEVVTYEREEEEEDVDLVTEIQLESLSIAARESDGTGTMANTSLRLASPSTTLTNGEDESHKLDSACADAANINHIGGGDVCVPSVVIDENLFMDEDLDDFDDVDDSDVD